MGPNALDSIKNREDQESHTALLYAAAEDATLVIAALVGDLTAFDTLARRYRKAIQFVAWQQVGSDTAAEDIAQDVLVAAFQSLPNLEEPAKFAGWLYAITRNRARRVAERERRTAAVDQAIGSAHTPTVSGASDPAAHWERHLQQQEIWDALAQISQEHREVLFLYYCEEWSQLQIADFLSIPETTVKGRLHRAREALRRLFAHSTDSPQTPKGNTNHEPV